MGNVICKRTCVVCGKSFDGSPRSKYCSDACRHTDQYSSTCIVCGKPTKRGCKTCSQECLKKHLSEVNQDPERKAKNTAKTKQTKLQRYGDPNYHNKEKAAQTMLEKYGATTFVHSESGKEKIKAIMNERYGVDYALQAQQFVDKMNKTIADRGGKSYRFHTPEWNAIMIEKYGTTIPYKNDSIKNKGIDTLLKRYGVTSPAKLDFVKEKMKQTCLKKYGVEYVFQSEEFKEKARKVLLTKYGVEYSYFLTRKISKVNKAFGELLSVDSYEYPLGKFQFDLKKGNTLIEVNPTVSHNSDVDYCYGLKSVDYHFNKTKAAREAGFECFNIWEWDNPDKIKDIFQPTLNLPARKCDVVFIDKTTSDTFLDAYHLQGSCRGDVFRVGLFYNNELVGVMTFGAPRYSARFQVELLRLCYLPTYSVVGGSKKMFKFFIDMCNPDSIVSYCDNSKFSGRVYSSLGFMLEDYGVPTAHWHREKDNVHITDALLRQRGADALLGTNYGKGTNNEEIMLKEGFVRVYDCGQSRYAWHKNLMKESGIQTSN